MQDPAYQPQPDAHDPRRTYAERGGQTLLAPDELRKLGLKDWLRDDAGSRASARADSPANEPEAQAAQPR